MGIEFVGINRNMLRQLRTIDGKIAGLLSGIFARKEPTGLDEVLRRAMMKFGSNGVAVRYKVLFRSKYYDPHAFALLPATIRRYSSLRLGDLLEIGAEVNKHGQVSCRKVRLLNEYRECPECCDSFFTRGTNLRFSKLPAKLARPVASLEQALARSVDYSVYTMQYLPVIQAIRAFLSRNRLQDSAYYVSCQGYLTVPLTSQRPRRWTDLYWLDSRPIFGIERGDKDAPFLSIGEYRQSLGASRRLPTRALTICPSCGGSGVMHENSHAHEIAE